MNSNYGRSTQSGSLNNFDFDLGLNSNRSKPLNAQSNNNNTYTQPKPKPNTMPSWQPNKPSWTHQPAAPSLNGPTSMVGDITGRSWASSTPTPNTAATSVGIAGKNPNLFSDLLGSNLGAGKGYAGNVPLKNAAPVSSQTNNNHKTSSMNSNYGRSTQSGSLNNFDFDLGLNSNRSNPLNAQSNNNNTYTQPKPKPNTTPSWQPNKPSWTHQPAAPSLNGPTSMVGDITGRSWASSTPTPNTAATSVGIAGKNPNLFSDLLGSNLGAGKGYAGNVPLKNAAPVSSQTNNRSAYSMGGMADSLPKTGGGGWGSGSSQGYGSYNSYGNNRNQNLGGPAMKSSSVSGTGIGIGGSMNSNKDPFGSLVDFSSKPAAGMKAGSKTAASKSSGDDVFGTFQNAKPSVGSHSKLDDFGFGGMKSQPAVQSKVDDFGFGSMQSQPTAQLKVDDFGFGSMQSQPTAQSKVDDFGFGGMKSQPPVQSSGVNDFDALFSSSSAGNASKGSEAFVNQQFAGAEDWGFEAEIGGGGGDVGGTTELEGLPPPPAGVTSSSAKVKGMDNYKAGQYPDAIKWLSWAVVLLEKAGDNAGTMEVLSSRASCYKEVGEYKKAVADCSKVLEQDGKNVAVLVQRALLYESMEKYKLGAEDLRTVMNIDPGNRVARSTIHRLTKLAG